jgi:hypothetical protein
MLVIKNYSNIVNYNKLVEDIIVIDVKETDAFYIFDFVVENNKQYTLTLKRKLSKDGYAYFGDIKSDTKFESVSFEKSFLQTKKSFLLALDIIVRNLVF